MVKRCPSCGRKADVKENMGLWGVSCTNCNFNILPEYETREDAVNAWNKRTEVSYNLNPESIMNFLQENEWTETSKDDDYAVYTYSKENIEIFEVKIPLKYGSENFESDMQEAVEMVADVMFDTVEDIIDSIWDEQVYCTHCFYYIDGKCVSATECCLGDPEDSAPISMRKNYRTMELGNFIFGHSRGKYPIDREMFQPIFYKYFDKNFDSYMYYEGVETDKITDRGGYENDVFKINPYYWGEDEDIIDEPNFIYKPENIEISWYKYPLRDSYSNTLLTKEKAEEIFSKCILSMK